MAVFLRVVAFFVMLGGLILAGGTLLADRDCGQFISHAPSYRACIEAAGPQAGTWGAALTMALGAAIVALAFLAFASMLDGTEQNRQMLQAIQTRLGEPKSVAE
ncbi:hypothetical protein M5E06_21085 [Azospirillum sp. A1-3]|uniref:hypothetical protein n=1 Tax=Azospirillum sp. A1-3 TaxID=185874 RepID=UPI0020777C59|nr:hypothetical protein [Azospirillum sp. A1-3]MCM8736625.1 hypothetical protein [Azospirillum sp. A1-3]